MTRPGSESEPLSPATLAILLALAQSEQHGYGILKRVESQPGAPRLGTGTLYAALQRLAEDGLIEESEARPAAVEDQRRRYYRITGAGEAVAGRELLRLSRIVARSESQALLGRLELPKPLRLAEER
jgi:DNA-binding PadR family transcriptional regulator